MKVFEKDNKTNFVDENNVLVGFDAYQSCCESFGWFIYDAILLAVPEEPPEGTGTDLGGWVFDPEFFESGGRDTEDDVRQVAVFRIVKGDQERFLHLYNCHNGYYSHGFHLDVGGKMIREGSL